ncbi:hypothetical protein M3Y97_00893200 [Aphelenchoides bicaudatus]|nr:hypothetical protein M3Y97_00893200 [Aphelenchoides bicaudatus]
MHRAKPTESTSRPPYVPQRNQQPQHLFGVRQKCQSGHDINNPVPTCCSCNNLKLARRRRGNPFYFNGDQHHSVPANRSFTLQANSLNRASTSSASNPYQAPTHIQTTSSTPANPLTFPHLPFFIVEHDIIPPQPLTANKVEHEYQSMVLDFKVPPEFHRGIEKGTHDIQLRIFKEENGFASIKYPLYFEVRLNKQLAGLNGKLEHQIGTKAVLTEPLMFGQSIKNSLNRSHLLRCQWKNYSNRDFRINLVVVKLLTIKDLYQKVWERVTWTEAITKKMVLKLYGQDEELEMQNFKETINCPYGNCRINVPARSIKCKHVRCFDLENFITINQKRPVWKCPTCNQEAPFSSIMIDQYFTKVIEAVKDNKKITEIELFKDGSWKPYTPKQVTDVVLEDSDNEDILKNIKKDVGSSSSGSSSLSGDQQQKKLPKSVNSAMDPRLNSRNNNTITRFLSKDPPPCVPNVAPSRPASNTTPDVITLEDSSDDEITESRTPIPAPLRSAEVITLSSPEVTPPSSPIRSNAARSPSLNAPSPTRNSQPRIGNLSSSQSRDSHLNIAPRLVEELLTGILSNSSNTSKESSTTEATPQVEVETLPEAEVEALPQVNEQQHERARSVEAVDESEFENLFGLTPTEEANEFSLQPDVLSALSSSNATTPVSEDVTPLQVQVSTSKANVNSQASAVSPFEEEGPDDVEQTKPKRRGRPAKAAPLAIRSRRNAPLLRPSIKATTPQAKQAAKCNQQIELPKPEVINLPPQQITTRGSGRRKSKIDGAESPSINVLDVVVIESEDENVDEEPKPKSPAKRGRKKQTPQLTIPKTTRSTTRKQQQTVLAPKLPVKRGRKPKAAEVLAEHNEVDVTPKSPAKRGRKPKPRASLNEEPVSPVSEHNEVDVTPKSPAKRGRKRKSTETVESPSLNKKRAVPAARQKEAKPKPSGRRGRNQRATVPNAEPEEVKPTIKQQRVRRQPSVILESPRKSSRINNKKSK